MRDHEGIQYMKELLADGCTAKQLHGWISEAEKARTACLNYLFTPGVWRVEFSRSFGQVPRIHYVETVATDTEEDVRCWQMEAVTAYNAARPMYEHRVRIQSIRPATEDDLEELLTLGD